MLSLLSNIVFSLLIEPIFGLIGLFVGSPFTWALITASVVCMVALAFIYKLAGKKISVQELAQSYAISSLLVWISLAASYRLLPKPQDIYNDPFAKGGFPLTAFLYPVPPLGSDQPPLSMWPNFFLNFFLWFAVGSIISYFLPKKLKTTPLIFISIYSLLWGAGYVAGLFD